MLLTKLKKSHIHEPGLPGQRWIILVCLMCSLASWSAVAEAAKIQYKFKSWNGPELKIFVTRPVGLAADRPIVFVLYDENPLAAGDREQWHQLALKHDFLLVAPEISRADLPGSRKPHLGNMFDENGRLKADSILSYFAIEALFDEVRSRFKMSADAYSLYGHSMGAQFAQRFVFYASTARVNRIVAANAAWYMMPDFDIAFPYGIGHSAVDRTRLEKGLQRQVLIMPSAEDPVDDQDELGRIPEVMAQGPNRLARGEAFFESARRVADELGVPFNWSFDTVEGTGHDNRSLAPAVIPFLLGEPVPF